MTSLTSFSRVVNFSAPAFLDDRTLCFLSNASGQWNIWRSDDWSPAARLTGNRSHAIRGVWPLPGGRLLTREDAAGPERCLLLERDAMSGAVLGRVGRVGDVSHLFHGETALAAPGPLYAAAVTVAGDRPRWEIRVRGAGDETVWAGNGPVVPVVVLDRRSAVVRAIRTNRQHALYLLDLDTGRVKRLSAPHPEGVYLPGPPVSGGQEFLIISDVGREFRSLGVMSRDGAIRWLTADGPDVEGVWASGDGTWAVMAVNVGASTPAPGSGTTRCRSRGSPPYGRPPPPGDGWAQAGSWLRLW